MLSVWNNGYSSAQRRWALKVLLTTCGFPFISSGAMEEGIYIYDALEAECLPNDLLTFVRHGSACVAIGGQSKNIQRIGSGFVFWTGQDLLEITINSLLLKTDPLKLSLSSPDFSTDRLLAHSVLINFVTACQNAASLIKLPLPILAQWPKARSYAVCLTHDVDWVSYKGYLSMSRLMARAGRDLLKRNFKAGAQRLIRIFKANWPHSHVVDPYDNFELYRQLETEYNVRSTFFLMVDHHSKRYGASYHLDSRLYGRISSLRADGWEFGLHGSYYGWQDPDVLRAEVEVIASFTGCSVIGGRQHYLHWALPQTWEAYQRAGLRYDSSVGFRNSVGHRSQFVFPYKAFNPNLDQEIDLWELPLSFMDSAVFGALRLDEDKAWALCQTHLASTAEANGLAIFLWHQNALDDVEFPGRKAVYMKLLERINRDQAWVGTASEVTRWWQARSNIELLDFDKNEHEIIWTYKSLEAIEDLVIKLPAELVISVNTSSQAKLFPIENILHVEFGALRSQQTFSISCQYREV